MRIPQRVLRTRATICLSGCLLLIIFADHFLVSRRAFGWGSRWAFSISFCFGLIAIGSLAALFPDNINVPRNLSASVCFAFTTVMLHITVKEWEPRPNQSDLQTSVRRVVMVSQSLFQGLFTALHAAEPILMHYPNTRRLAIEPWRAIRLMFFGVGAFDLVHTIWLHQLYIFSPTTDLDAPVDYVCGTRQGGPSYALSLALLSLACVFNEDVRRILARRTGGAVLALQLHQLKSEELRTLVPQARKRDLRRRVCDNVLNAHETRSHSSKSDSRSDSDGAANRRRGWTRDPAVQQDSSEQEGEEERSGSASFSRSGEGGSGSFKGRRERLSHAHQRQRTRKSSPTTSSGHESWSSYGRRWEADWQEKREKEIEESCLKNAMTALEGDVHWHDMVGGEVGGPPNVGQGW